MSGFVALSPENRQTTPKLGDLVALEILVDEKLPLPLESWQIKAPEGTVWISSGNLTIATDSLKSMPSEGTTTKFSVDALVHQPGPLVNEVFTLIDKNSGREILINRGELGKEVELTQTTEKEEPPWVLPPIAFGGWNYFLIALLTLILVIAVYAAFKRFGQRLPGRRKLNHRDAAIQSLHPLQKFARSKKAMEQEEWKKFSFELARIIRKYSDENFKFDSSDMTDREFLAELRLNAKARPLVDNLSGVLGIIDEVRYGKKGLDATAVPSLLLEARKFFELAYAPKEGEGGK